MTRETKIGLLVGLAFIIVIGILLSDQRRGADAVPVPLAGAGTVAGAAMRQPGSVAHVTNIQNNDPTPSGTVVLPRELQPPVIPVTPVRRDPRAVAGSDGSHTGTVGVSPTGDLASRFPGDLERVGGAPADGGTHVVPPDPAPRTTPTAAGPKSYKAQSGDTVSRMASKYLGANTLTNRQAIINANPSLQENPDNVVIGRTYVIPGAATGSTPPVAIAPSTPTPAAPSTGEYYYTVEEGDTLWAIATDELGDAGAVSAIKELNRNILKGENHDIVRPGMKIRLPGKPVASAN